MIELNGWIDNTKRIRDMLYNQVYMDLKINVMKFMVWERLDLEDILVNRSDYHFPSIIKRPLGQS